MSYRSFLRKVTTVKTIEQSGESVESGDIQRIMPAQPAENRELIPEPVIEQIMFPIPEIVIRQNMFTVPAAAPVIRQNKITSSDTDTLIEQIMFSIPSSDAEPAAEQTAALISASVQTAEPVSPAPVPAPDFPEAVAESEISDIPAAPAESGTSDALAAVTVRELLRQRGFRIISYKKQDAPEGVMKLAQRMAKDYPQIKGFCKVLRSCGSGTNKKFSYIAPESGMEQTTKFAEELRRYGMIILPEQISSAAGCPGRTISGRISESPQVTNFLNGLWLEKYAAGAAEEMAEKAAARLGVDYEVLTNVMVEEIETGIHNELDLLIRVGSHLLWIECKCGNFHEAAYMKYRDLGLRMSVVPDHMLLLSADLLNQETGDVISYFYQYTVCGLDQYRRYLNEMLQRCRG